MPIKRQRGVTLIEMIMVVALIGIMVGITFPSISSGIDSIRIASASDSIASMLNSALNLANRRQEVVEVEISLVNNTMRVRSAISGFDRTLDMPRGVEIRDVIPPIPVDRSVSRRFLIYPGGTAPRLGLEIVNSRGALRRVRVDPITGVPQIERGASR